jgi:8-oxo-dGTP diphosphatase
MTESDPLHSLSNLPRAQRWREQGFPAASVLALIRHPQSEGGILLIRRQKEPYSGKWGLVGGRWEFGETLDGAILREVAEETGLQAEFVALRGLVNERIAPVDAEGNGAHFVLFVCELTAPDGNAQEQAEGPVAWFSPAELTRLADQGRIIASDYAIIQRFSSAGDGLSYIEAEVLSGGQGEGVERLLRFAPGPEFQSL